MINTPPRPIVSVIMSAYNAEKTIKNSVQSILEQTFSDFEIIIVNDGSTDNTHSILTELSEVDRRLLLIQNNKNIGLTPSLNKALLMAQGNFVARLDADDYMYPSRLEQQVKFMTHNPTCDVLGTSIRLFDDKAETSNKIQKVPCNTEQIIWHLLTSRASLFHPSVMIKTTLLKAHRYDEAYKVSQDFDLWHRLIGVTNFANLPEPLTAYYSGTNRISKKHILSQTENTLDILARSIFDLTEIKFSKPQIKNYISFFKPQASLSSKERKSASSHARIIADKLYVKGIFSKNFHRAILQEINDILLLKSDLPSPLLSIIFFARHKIRLIRNFLFKPLKL